MKLSLNPYALVLKINDTFSFVLSDQNNPVTLKPKDEQLNVLERLYNKEFIEYEYLCGIFQKEVIDSLVSSGCLVPVSIDTQSIYSRTNAFFMTYNMPDAREKLNQKNVLILGCGGIGTHMAWHMTALGIRKLTLVDFDTVETSNFNRQILFNNNDVGKEKTKVLKEKLANINSNIQIDTICTKISSENELENICLSDKYDLIIKALDSPADFSVWLDNVAKKYNLTYISGITLRNNVLIGPSHIPGKSRYTWKELMTIPDNDGEKLFGTASSIGIMLYNISSELAIEAFKILTGYGKLKFVDKVLCKNLFTEEEYYFEGEADAKNKKTLDNKRSGKELKLEILLILSLTAAGYFESLFFIIAFIASIIIPNFLYKEDTDVIKCTFLNAVVCSLGGVAAFINRLDIGTVYSLISSVFILFGVYSAAILFMCFINYFINKVVVILRNHKIK